MFLVPTPSEIGLEHYYWASDLSQVNFSIFANFHNAFKHGGPYSGTSDIRQINKNTMGYDKGMFLLHYWDFTTLCAICERTSGLPKFHINDY